MPKTSGYMRSYRAERRANRGRPLGRALRGGEADEMRALMAGGMSPAQARRQVTWANDMLRDQMAIMQGDFSRLRPKGRAPRGMGQEYAARRQIASMWDRSNRSIGNMRYSRRQYRGTRQGRWNETQRQNREASMRAFQNKARGIIQGPGSWRQKAARVNELYQTAVWQSSPYN